MKELGEQWIDKDGNMQKCIWTDGNAYTTKDLGHVNEDGCLPCPFCGEYPTLKEELDENGSRIYAIEHECNIDMTTGWDHDKQTVIDAWNRRAR